MAKNTIPRGETSVIRHIFIQDSTSTSGAGKTNLAFGDVTAYYIYAGGTATALTTETITTLGTYAAPTSNAHIRFKKIDDTNMPGWYEIHMHNDWFSVANGRKTACVQIKGTGLAPLNLEIDVIGMEVQSATPGSNVSSIAGDTASATTLSKSVKGVITGSAVTGTLSSTQMKTDLTEATDNHYIGRLVIWTSGTLLGQYSTITDYDGTNKILTYDATQTSESPSNADTFIIV